MKNILVTGGAGFIGSNFIRFMLNKYPEIKILNLDKLTYAGNLNSLKGIENNKNYRFIWGDIYDEKLVDNIAKDCDTIINFAAETHVDRSIKDASKFLKTDVFGTCTLLEAARKHDIKKFVQISTDEVYGHIIDGSFKETTPLNPRNPYSATKAAADRLAYSYFCTYDLPVVITRSSNNYGPYQYPEKIIPLFVTNLLRGLNVPVYGEGKQIRDWLFVADNCEAIDIVSKKGINGEAYNIGGENELKNIELTRNILKILNKPETMIDYVPDRLGHDFRYSLDCSKIKKLGWLPKTKFEDGLKKTVEWYVNNEWWWKPLLKL